MKLNRTSIFIAITSCALLIILIIQVNWIVETARIKEEFFNEKSNIVCARTTEALSADNEVCKNLEAGNVGENENRKIDSLTRLYMRYYNFNVNYSFQVIRSQPLIFKNEIGKQTQQACNTKSLNELSSKNGWELKFSFPGKEEFIRAEMKLPFIASVVLILVVLILFWRTVLSLTTEKKIAEHTTDFLNNMTHEFKTPLTNIALAGKMIVKNSSIKQEDKIKHYSGIILAENEKLRLQVEQILSMTALERGEIPLQKTELDFHQLLTDSLKPISIQIEHKEGSLKMNLEAQHFVIMGDKVHLANAICNLVDNAIKYSGEKPEVHIQTSNSDGNLIVVVSDKGFGIEEKYQKKVFDKFFRVPTGDVHDIKGFGLGLAYVKKIIELHGGIIEMTSEKESGTTFTITLPNV
jgi:two-component system, OmpR family, phosphate regulon sensor histidine kinase PhoR